MKSALFFFNQKNFIKMEVKHSRLLEWAKSILEEPAEGLEIEETPLGIEIEFVAFLKWLHHNVVTPVFLIALIINLTIMFTAPVEVTFQKWLLLKDPLSLIAGFLIFKLIRRLSARRS